MHGFDMCFGNRSDFSQSSNSLCVATCSSVMQDCRLDLAVNKNLMSVIFSWLLCFSRLVLSQNKKQDHR